MKDLNEKLESLLNEEVNTEKLLELIASLEKDGEKVVVYNASNKQRISPQKLADLKIKKYTQDLTSEPVQIFVELDNEEKKSDKKEKYDKKINENYTVYDTLIKKVERNKRHDMYLSGMRDALATVYALIALKDSDIKGINSLINTIDKYIEE